MADETELPTQSGRESDLVIPERPLSANDSDAELLEKAREVAPTALKKFLKENGFEEEWLASPEELRFSVLDTIIRQLPPGAPDNYESRLNDALEQAINESIAALSGTPGPIQNALEGLREFGTVIINALQEVATVATELAADPVTPFDGQFIHTVTDLSIPGAGMDFQFTRTYKSQATYLGPLGHNWDHNYNLWIRRSVDGTKLFRSTGSVREDEYVKHPVHDYFVPPDGQTSILESSGSFLLLQTDSGIRYRYGHQHGELPLVLCVSQIEDIFGNRLTFEYENDRLSIVKINNDHRHVRFSYSSHGQLIQIEDHTGRKWHFCYDDFSDLVSVLGPSDDNHQHCRRTCYEYSSSHYSGAASHNLVRIFDAEQNLYVENEYGAIEEDVSYNRVIRQRLAQGETYFEYADVVPEFGSELSESERPAHETIVTERNGQRIRQVFNRFGNLLLRDEYIVVAGVPQIARSYYRYNRDGMRVAMLSAEGRMHQSLYGRELFERKINATLSEDISEHEQLTALERQSFQRIQVIVQRNRRFRLTDLTQARGVWGDIFPDIVAGFDLDDEGNTEDRIRKFTYEPAFGRISTEADPRFTNSADPNVQSVAAGEHPRYEETLVRYRYRHANSLENRFLLEIEYPRLSRPDGTFGAPVVEKYTNADGSPAYDSRGRPLRRTDQLGVITEYAYFDDVLPNGGYLRSRTIDPQGLAIRVRNHVDSLGRITSKELPRFVSQVDGRFVVRYKYDATDQITEITNSAPFSHKTVNFYDRIGQLVRTYRELKNENGLPEAGGIHSSIFSYDSESHVTVSTSGGRDLSGHLATQHLFDSAGNQTFTIFPGGNFHRTVYDERQLPKRMIAGDNLRTVTSQWTQYDGDGNVVREIDALGNVSRYEYDSFGQLIHHEDPLGNVTRLNYDKAGNLICTREFEKVGDEYFLLKRKISEYDELRRPISEGANLFEEPIGPFTILELAKAELSSPGPGTLVQTQTIYDAVDRSETTVDHSGLRKSRFFDALGRFVRSVDPLGNETTVAYDKHSNIVRTDRRYVVRNEAGDSIGNEFFSSSSTYDELDRVTSTTDTLGNTTRCFYDSRGNVVRTIDPLGNEVRATFDVYNRAVSTTRLMTTSGVGPPDSTTQSLTAFNEYDDNGNLIRAIDAMGRITEYEYDALELNRSTTFPDGSQSITDFDDNGNVLSVTDVNGLRRVFTVDPLGRTIRVDVDGSALPQGLDIRGATFARSRYDGCDRQIEAENDFSFCRKVFNSFDQAIVETVRSKIPEAQRLMPLVTKRRYNDHGAISHIEYPGGREIRFERDDLNRVTRISNVSNGQGYSGNATAPENRHLAEIVYRGAHRSLCRQSNDTQIRYRHDGAGRLLEVSHTRNTQELLSLTYLYDAVGSVRVRNSNEGGVRQTTRFAFDSRYQLTSEVIPDSPEIFDTSGLGPATAALSDPIPNRQASISALIGSFHQPAVNHSFEYDGNQNRSLDRMGPVPAGYDVNELDQYERRSTTQYRYDGNGNLMDDGRFRYFYDSMNRLVEVRTLNGEEVGRFWHDALGRRVVERIAGDVTELVYDRLNVIEEYRNGDLFAQFVHDVGTDQLLHVAADGKEHWVHKDLIGSVRFLTNENGDVSASYRYGAFGEAVDVNDGNGYNPYRYAGRRLDEQTGSYDYRARQYSPHLGRFLQRDPIGTEDGSNLYAYCANNPLNRTDPSGTSREEREVSFQAMAGAGVAGLREFAKPTLKSGGKPTGWLHLWSDPKVGKPSAAQAITDNRPRADWIFDDTRAHARATQAEADVFARNNWAQGQRVNNVDYHNQINKPIWIPESKRLAGGTAFSQLPIQSHNAVDPNSIQVKYEIPAAHFWGTLSGALSGFSGGFTIYSAITSDNALVATTGTVAGTTEVVGSGMYVTGLLSGTPELAAIGGQFVRFGGGFGLVFVSGYDFVNDVSNGDVAGAIGSGAGTGTGVALIAGSGPGALLLGEFTLVYEGSRWVSAKTGWGNDSGEEGAAVTNWIQGKDPGAIRKGFAHSAGFVVTASGVLVREPLGALDSAIMPKGRTLSPITGIKRLIRGQSPFW